MKRLTLAGILFAAVLLLGAGCSWFRAVGDTTGDTSSTSTSMKGTPAQVAAKRIQFQPSDTFEIRQTLLGLGASLPDLKRSKDGVRLVSFKHFATQQFAELGWNLTVERETAASVSARQTYEQNLKKRTLRDGILAPTPPTPAFEKVSASGTILNANLATSHNLFPPAYWESREVNLLSDASAIWVSDDAFLELTRTKTTSLNFGFLDQKAGTLLKNAGDAKAALDAIRNQATGIEKTKDVTLVTLDGEEEMPLVVNGKEIKVSVLKAHNWFGEIVILNNRQNPLILKMTLNPLYAGAAELIRKGTGLEHLFGYEVTNVGVANF